MPSDFVSAITGALQSDRGRLSAAAAQYRGLADRYRALVERVQARESALERLTRKLFQGSPELLLTHLVSQKKLSEAELRRLRDLVEDQLPEEER